MQTFKCFFKIIKANFKTLVMYTGIFIAMALAIGIFFGGGLIRFERVSTTIGVVNRHNHLVSQGLLDYLESIHTLIPLEDDMTALEDAIFFFQVRYVLIIDEDGLWHVTAPHNMELNIYINRQIDTFMQTVHAYLAAGFDYDEAIYLAKQDQQHLVTILSPEESTFVSMYFSSLVYLFKSLIVMTLGFVLMVFREKNIADRLAVSPTTSKSRTLWLSLACASTALGMWALVMVPAHFLHHESLFSLRGSLHMLNALVLAIVSVCIGVLLTRIVKNEDGLIRFSTLIAFISGFASGMITPIAMMDDFVHSIARIIPAYWYGHSNMVLLNDVIGQDAHMSDFWQGIIIQLCFAAAIFTIALVIGREKSRAQV